MRLTFRVRYGTRLGQSVWLTGPHEIFGRGELDKALPLEYRDQQTWQATVFIPEAFLPETNLTYQYVVRDADGSSIEDWGLDRSLNLRELHCDELLVVDGWNHPGYVENVFYTEPFQRVLLKERQTEFAPPCSEFFTHRFRAKAPLLQAHETLCLLGNSEKLAAWSTAKPLLMARRAGQQFLEAAVDLTETTFPLRYKYGVYDWRKQAFVRFEDGADRMLDDTTAPHKQTIIQDGFARLPATSWKGAGVAVPVFSLHSETGFGVGEFADLKKLTDWCAQTGLRLIQILPVNDTTATHTWTDSYPYAAISAFALHPLYVNLTLVAEPKNRGLLEPYEETRKRLNDAPSVEYEAVMQTKLEILQLLYKQQRDKAFRSKEYRGFFQQNKDWLVPYALFCYLRDQYGSAEFTKWPAHRQYVTQPAPTAETAQPGGTVPDPASAAAAPAAPATADPIAFHYFVQFHLHRQLASAARYAHERGIILKGDIPIGVYRYGADAWQAPELYQMDMQAGAPPDAFAIKGQNWGFPTYNWDQMKETDYAWWKRRFRQMSRYFDAFRIDHILGFFRIWSVPFHAVEGIMGHFVPALPVRPEEFTRRGIAFVRDRFVLPYITDQVLAGIFGSEAAFVKEQFLLEQGSGTYLLKPEFSAQRLVEAHFDNLPEEARNASLKRGLFDLISNVLLFEEENAPGAFHFRFAIESTTSFEALDPQTRTEVWNLYIDYYFRRQEEFWRKEGLEKLPALKLATDMLVCGEDLGLVPACVPEVMRDLGLLGLEIQRMPKVLHREFSRPLDAPYLTVVTPSSHDMSTIRGWWKENRALTQRFFNEELGRPGPAPEECDVSIVGQIIDQHLASPAMWSIFQIQDLLGLDAAIRNPDIDSERINVPANPRNYWRYRLHLPLESLLSAHAFNNSLRERITSHGRAPASHSVPA